jgi:chemotaxis protein MotA
MGMIGTLIGLVAMFTRMSDPATIGGAMAVALLATLYGAVLANLIAMPIAARLRSAGRAEAVGRQRLEPALVALAAREAPRAVHFMPASDTLYAEPIDDAADAMIDGIEDAA